MRRRGAAHLVLGRWAVGVGALVAGIVFGACPARAAFPGRNGPLAVVVGAGAGGPGRVLIASAHGSRPRQVATGAVSVSWSAGGDSLVLGLPCVKSGCGGNEGGPAGPGALRLVSPQTGRARRIKTSSSPEMFEGPRDPSWTRGGRLLWTRHVPVEGGATDVVLADRAGRHQRLVTPPGAVFGAVARAAPTGGSIAVAVTSPSQRLVLVPAGGGGGERVLINCDVPPGQREPAAPPCPLSIGRLDWSPDGTQIAFDQTYPAPMVRVLDLASGVVRDVRPGGAPFWSPDGRLLGSVSPGRRIEIGPPAPGPVRTLPLHGVIAADWQPR